MTLLADILDVDNLRAMVDQGYIRTQTNIFGTQTIYNYTDKAVYDGVWNHETMTCRGLIVGWGEDGQRVVARPFSKFWSLSQHESPNVPDAPTGTQFRIFDKADGSLGILYPVNPLGLFNPYRYAIATRGSFNGIQAKIATSILNHKYADWLKVWDAIPGNLNRTLLFEIIYPENRIVLDYGDTKDLVYLGSVNIETGVTSMGDAAIWEWPGPVAEEYWALTLEDIQASNRPNKEGYVLWYTDSDTRVKVKHTEYLYLHRLITNSNTKTIWKALSSGSLDDLMALPDEFRTGIDACVAGLRDRYTSAEAEALSIYDSRPDLPPGRDLAAYVIASSSTPSIRAAVFALVNGKPYEPIIWKAIEPDHAESVW